MNPEKIKELRSSGYKDEDIASVIAEKNEEAASLLKQGMPPTAVINNIVGIEEAVQLTDDEVAQQVVKREMPDAPQDDVSVKAMLAGLGAEVAISEGAKIAGTAYGAKAGLAGGPFAKVTVPAGAAGGYIVGAVGGGITGSLTAQKIEGQPKISWGRVTADTMLNLIPFGELKKGPRVLQAVSKEMVKRPIASKVVAGAALSPAGLAVERLIETGELPKGQEVATTSVLGSALGGALGITSIQAQKLLGRMSKKTPQDIDAMIANGDVGAISYVDMLTKNVDPKVLNESITPAQFKNWLISGDLKAKIVPSSVVGKEVAQEVRVGRWRAQAGKDIGGTLLKNVNDAIEKSPNPEQAERFANDYLLGITKDVPVGMEGLAEQLSLGRKYIRESQQEILANHYSGQREIPEVMKNKIEESLNQGDYVTRAYRFFEDGAYTPTEAQYKSLMKRLVDDGMDTEKAALYIAELNAKKAGTPDEMAQYIFSQNAGILKNRKEMSPELKNYLGEYTDVGSNLGFTVSKLAKLASYDTADSKVAQILFDTGLLKVADENSMGMIPINLRRGEAHLGDKVLVGSPEIQTALNELYGQRADDLVGDLATVSIKDFWQTGTSLSKAAKVVFNPASYATNFVGALFSNATMANNPLRGLKVGVKGGLGQFANGRLHSVAGMKTIKDIDYFKELKEVGMLPPSMRFADIQSGLQSGKLGTLASKIIDPVGKVYSIPDIMARVSVYENQKSILRKAAVGADEKQIHRLAAEMANNTYMNYDMLNSSLKTLSRNGVPLSQFASFTLELARTQYNQGNIARKMFNGEMAKELSAKLGVEVNADELRKEGIKRIIATAAVYGGGAAAITAFNRDSVTTEQEKALRETIVPEWDENVPLLIKRDKDGKVYTKNATYLVPQMQLVAPFMSAFRGESFGDSLNKLASTAGDGVLENGGFMLKGVYQALANYDVEAQQKITTDPTLYGKLIEQSAWASKELFQPGFVREYKKAQENPLSVTAMRLGGLRVNSTTEQKGFGFRLREVQSNLDTVKDQLASARYEKADQIGRLLNREELGYTYDNILNPLYKTHQKKLIKHVKNMRVLGHDNDSIMRMMRDGGISNLEALNAIDGNVEDLPLIDRKTVADSYDEIMKQPGDIYKKILDVAKIDKPLARELGSYHKQQTRDKMLNVSGRDNAIKNLDTKKQAEFIHREMLRSDNPDALLQQYLKKRIVSAEAYKAILLKMKNDKQ